MDDIGGTTMVDQPEDQSMINYYTGSVDLQTDLCEQTSGTTVSVPISEEWLAILFEAPILLRRRIAVAPDDWATVFNLLLDIGGGRALRGNRFDVTDYQIAVLAQEQVDFRVVGFGEPLRDHSALHRQ